MPMYEDYLMLLSPPEAIKHEISRYKKASAKIIGNYKSINSPAHISIMHMERQKPFMADKNVELMEQTLAQLPPVLLHWDGFAHFTHLHKKMTIYGNIRSTPASDEWFNQLKKKLKIKKNIAPHITVVRDVPEEKFNMLWPHFRHKKLVEPFWINALTVVKRDTFDAYAQWEFFKSFGFKNKTGFIGANNIEAGRIDVADQDQFNLF